MQMREILDSAKGFVKGVYAPKISATKSREISLDLDYRADIPQAEIIEKNLEALQVRDWRTHFAAKLAGRGLEIGPLHRPMVKHDKMNVEYIDRFPVAVLREHYPELRELPLIEPDILGDAESLQNIPNASYDFLISAHVIEHTRNPLSSMEQWCRVCKNGGLIYLVVPDKRAIFDKKRVRTTLPHIIWDYQNPDKKRDFEHFIDYAIHVHGKSGLDAIIEAKKLETTDYSIHFHVFIPTDILNLLNWFSNNIRKIEILEGPSMAPGSDEFHFLIKVV